MLAAPGLTIDDDPRRERYPTPRGIAGETVSMWGGSASTVPIHASSSSGWSRTTSGKGRPGTRCRLPPSSMRAVWRMPSYRFLLEYDGTAFHGWQVQTHVRTVQGEVERALGLLTRRRIRTAAAGRTDSGVHARGQVVSFDCEALLDCRRVAAGIEGICGRELKVRRLEEAPSGFHARHDARWRLYRYRILLTPERPHRERCWYVVVISACRSCGRRLRPSSEPAISARLRTRARRHPSGLLGRSRGVGVHGGGTCLHDPCGSLPLQDGPYGGGNGRCGKPGPEGEGPNGSRGSCGSAIGA